jgi:hypothetical protein
MAHTMLPAAITNTRAEILDIRIFLPGSSCGSLAPRADFS